MLKMIFAEVFLLEHGLFVKLEPSVDTRKVMFSVVSVHHSVYRGVPCDLNVQGPPMLVTSGSHHWKPVQMCLLNDPPPTTADIWWLF